MPVSVILSDPRSTVTVVAYRRSLPLARWMDERRVSIDTLERAHVAIGAVQGPGRPREEGRPLAHAYVLRVTAEFQGYVRDLHDLAVEVLVEGSGAGTPFRSMLVTAATEGRGVDRGNADVRIIQADFRRIGLTSMNDRIGLRQPLWSTKDRLAYADIIDLRNCLAHGNSTQLASLRSRGVLDTVSWTRQRLPSLNRTARAMDRVVWEHLRQTIGQDPWG